MFIHRETFENASEDEREAFSIPDLVFGFLATHLDREFKTQEIATYFGVGRWPTSTL